MPNILITAPSLDESLNISGISSLTKTIVNENSENHSYFHFILGKKDSESKDFKWAVRQITLLPRFLLFVSKNNIDIVHLNTDLTPQSIIRDFPLAIASRYLLRKKVLLHLHGGRFLMKAPRKSSVFHWMIKSMLKTASSRVVLSHIEKKEIQNHYHIDCIIMPNAVASIKQSNLKDFSGKLSFLFMGRMVQAKGIFLIAECLQDLGEYLKGFDLKIYGNGPDLEEFLAKLANIKNLNYAYCGIAKGRQKEDAFEDAHIFLLPSLFGEGLPIAMLESMNHGCVPLVSDDASIGTVITDEVNGYLVKKGNLNNLKEKIIKALNDKEGLSELSRQAKSTVHTSYNLENYIHLLNNTYKNLGKDERNKFFGNRNESSNIRGVIRENR